MDVMGLREMKAQLLAIKIEGYVLGMYILETNGVEYKH